MSLIFISNLNHVLKKIKFIFNFKNKMKIKIFYVAERYHFYDGVHHAQVKPYVIWKKQLLFYKEIYIKTEHKVQRKWVDKIWLGKIMETGWKEKRSGGKRKSYYGFKKLLYFIDAKAFSRNLGKYKLIQVFKTYTYVT